MALSSLLGVQVAVGGMLVVDARWTGSEDDGRRWSSRAAVWESIRGQGCCGWRAETRRERRSVCICLAVDV